MSLGRSLLKPLILALPLIVLTGCGDGWEMRPYNRAPYDGDRTAGTGVEYVRAKMMPKKGPVTDAPPPAPAPAPAAEAPPPPSAPVQDAAPIFNDKIKK